MVNPVVVLAACMAPLGGVDMSTFSGRLALQKHVYLMQLFGIDLGYRFNWYLHGPYSPALAERGFEIEERKDSIERLAESVALQDWVKDRLKQYEKLIAEKPEETSLELWLEILASLHYLKHVMPGPSADKRSEDFVVHELLRRKPNLGRHRSTMTRAWEALQNVGLTEHKTLP